MADSNDAPSELQPLAHEPDQRGASPGGSALLQRAVRNSIFAGLGTASLFLLGFFFAGMTVRMLGEARAGYLLTLQAVIGLNAILGGFGLGTPSIRRIADLQSRGQVDQARAVVASVTTMNIVTGLALSLLIVVFFPQIYALSRLDAAYQSDAWLATLFVMGTFMLSQITGPWQSVYRAVQRYDLLTALSTAFGLLTSVVGIIVLSVAPTMMAISIAGFIITFARVLMDGLYMKLLLGRVPGLDWQWQEMRPMLSFGGWTALATLGGLLFTNIDRLVLASFMGSAVLAYYVLPQRLFAQTHTMLVSQAEFIFPMLSAFGSQAAAQIERLEDRLRWFVAVFSAVTYVSLMFIGPLILSRLVSAEFAAYATIPLVLACVQGFFNAQNIVPYYSSWAIGAGAPNAVVQLLNGLLVTVTAVLLIPAYGYLGVSVAQLWIVPIVFLHSVWVRRLILPKAQRWTWLRAYISPALMIAAWLAVTFLGYTLAAAYAASFYLWVALGGAVGMLVLWLVERFVFPADQRWSTLMRAVEVPVRRFKQATLARS